MIVTDKEKRVPPGRRKLLRVAVIALLTVGMVTAAAGLLDEPANAHAVMRVFVDSRAGWDCADHSTPAFSDMPDADTMDALTTRPQDDTEDGVLS